MDSFFLGIVTLDFVGSLSTHDSGFAYLLRRQRGAAYYVPRAANAASAQRTTRIIRTVLLSTSPGTNRYNLAKQTNESVNQAAINTAVSSTLANMLIDIIARPMQNARIA